MRVSRAAELELTSRRPDGSYRPYVTIWVVGAADCLYVRSAYGWNSRWFQWALKSGEGRIRAAGVERDVAFEQPRPDIAAAVTAAYHAKYDRYGPLDRRHRHLGGGRQGNAAAGATVGSAGCHPAGRIHRSVPAISHSSGSGTFRSLRSV
jgi:hypothetical protein